MITMRKILFICSTPYQLLALLKIKKIYLDENYVDILLTDAVNQFENWINMERLSCFFSNVFRCRIYEYAKETISNFDVNKNYDELTKYVIDELSYLDNDYTDVFIANTHSWIIEWSNIYKKCVAGKEVKFHCFDDGIYSYINFDYDYALAELGIEDVYLYEKELLCVDCDIPIFPISLNSQCKIDNLESLFVNGKLQLDVYNYVLLEHHFSDKKFYKLQDEFFKIIYENNPEGTVLKPHHRRRKRTETDMSVMESMIPFEVLLQKSNKSLTLVTVFSTAVLFAPYISKKPLKIVLLYRIFKSYFSDEEYAQMDRFVKKLKTMFEYKHQFIIPKTCNELQEFLNV